MPMVDMGVSENRGTYLGVLIIRILLFRVLCYGPLFSETPIYEQGISYSSLLRLSEIEQICRAV